MTFQVLLIGPGSIGRRHARNIKLLRPDATFTVKRARQLEDDFTLEIGADIVTDLALIDLSNYSLAVVASPSADHIDVLPQLIAAAVPMLVEKPVVSRLEDCDVVENALSHAPTAPRIMGFNFRHLSSLEKLRSLIVEQRLGKIVRATLTAGLWLPDWRPNQDWRQGYSADSARGGGVELDLAHEPDIARWLFGELDLAASVGGSFSQLGIKAHDTAAMLLRGRHGACPLVQIGLDYVSRRRIRRYEIIGDEATAIWSIDGQLDLLTSTQIESVTCDMDEFDVAQSYIRMTKRMLAAIDGVWQESLQTLADGLKSTRLVLQARGDDAS